MSNADASWSAPLGLPPDPSDPSGPPPGPPPVPRPRRVAYVFAVVMPLVLLATLALPAAAVVWLLPALRVPASAAAPASPNPGSSDGQSGLGDPYYPQAGNSGYDVIRYQIALDWDPGTASLTAVTTISARATQQLDSFFYDLALHTDSVRVNGQPATFEQRGFSDVYVRPAQPITPGSSFQVVVYYSGAPGKIDAHGGFQPFSVTGQEWTVAGEPEASAWWFPANDHPSDPALMDTSIRVPAGLQAISVGRLVSADSGTEKDFDTWHWASRQPMATFLNFFSIGHYELRQGVDGGLPFLYAVSAQLSPAQRRTAFAALATSGAKIRTLETMFGPYPFSELGGVVPAHKLEFGGLEAQTRPVYNAGSILDPGFSDTLITHELAHMWFGDNVTVKQWNDIVDSEGYASWAEWGYAERTGGRTANDAMNEAFSRVADRTGFWRTTLIDPSREHLFDSAVYVRGPMMLQGLRNVIGDNAFFSLARDWSQDPGSRSLEDWMATAQSETTIDLAPFFQAWVYSPTAPARTAANGFRD